MGWVVQHNYQWRILPSCLEIFIVFLGWKCPTSFAVHLICQIEELWSIFFMLKYSHTVIKPCLSLWAPKWLSQRHMSCVFHHSCEPFLKCCCLTSLRNCSPQSWTGIPCPSGASISARCNTVNQGCSCTSGPWSDYFCLLARHCF